MDQQKIPIFTVPSVTNYQQDQHHHQQQQQPGVILGYPPVPNPFPNAYPTQQQQYSNTTYPPAGYNTYATTATSSSGYNPMLNQPQPQPQPQPPYFVTPGPSHSLPDYTKQVVVIGSQYCSPNPVDLIITRKVLKLTHGNFVVEDVNGNIKFQVKDGIQLLRDRRVLRDAEGKPIVTMQKKIMTAHNRWNAFRGDSRNETDLIFNAKESSMIQFRTKLDVFLASNGTEGLCNFKVKGSWMERSCVIYGGDSNIIAQMHKKITVGSVLVGKDKFTVTVYPNVDCAFIVSLIVILDAINHDHV